MERGSRGTLAAVGLAVGAVKGRGCEFERSTVGALNVKVFDAPPALAVDGATSATAPENNIPLKMSAVSCRATSTFVNALSIRTYPSSNGWTGNVRSRLNSSSGAVEGMSHSSTIVIVRFHVIC